MNNAMPERIISFACLLTLSSSEEVHSIAPGPPRLIEAALVLYWCMVSIVHCIPAITVANEPEPPASSTLTPTRWACGAIPGCSYVGAPVPAVVPPQ